jgi:methionyl-tRNA formyltransferase
VENNKTLKIATRDGYIEVLELQLEGKKRLQAVDFINGLRLGPNGEPRVTR